MALALKGKIQLLMTAYFTSPSEKGQNAFIDLLQLL